jgi:hypothetical protein
MFGGVIAVAGLFTLNLVPAVIGAGLALAGWFWLKRVPDFTPRPGGPGSDL